MGMDTRNGRIYPMEQVQKKPDEQKKFFKEMNIPPTQKQLNRKQRRLLLNEPCGCGSGKKFKNCCMVKTSEV